ncbi:MAG: hypothetical protein LBE35_11660 [Clostridiales bacterium]|jgi:hypothetical protein|nr:hypothetical protein [Clostridiales bacterium]
MNPGDFDFLFFIIVIIIIVVVINRATAAGNDAKYTNFKRKNPNATCVNCAHKIIKPAPGPGKVYVTCGKGRLLGEVDIEKYFCLLWVKD